MNHIEEYTENLQRWLETNRLAPQAQLMYLKLVEAFRQADWPEELQMSNPRLQVWAGYRCVQTVIRCRAALVRAGLLWYRKGKKGAPGCYRLRPVSDWVRTPLPGPAGGKEALA